MQYYDDTEQQELIYEQTLNALRNANAHIYIDSLNPSELVAKNFSKIENRLGFAIKSEKESIEAQIQQKNQDIAQQAAANKKSKKGQTSPQN